MAGILIAGVGNIFHGDDAFGSEVARRLAQQPPPSVARVVDFGIRGHDLAFALQDDYEAVILVDVAQRRRPPGTLSVVEADVTQWPDGETEVGIDTHAMNPMRIVRCLQAQGCKMPPLWIVACEPLTFGPDEGCVGLSEPVAMAVPEAVALVRSLLESMVHHGK
jgi:hydrogenase maturation protease